MRKHNIHVHSNLSDGVLSLDDLLEKARGTDLEIIGICDHAFSSKLPSKYQVTSNIDGYLAILEKLKSRETSIKVLVGIEIDISMIFGISPESLPFKTLNAFDYILFEYVNTEYEYWGKVGLRDISELVEIRDQLSVPIGLAHNDLQLNFNGKESFITRLLADNDIFVEIQRSEKHSRRGTGRNTRNGYDYYELFSGKLVDEMVSHGVKIAIGTDSHTGSNLNDLDCVYDFIEKNGLSLHELVL